MTPEKALKCWESAAELANSLIAKGHVDADNEAYDGVRALYQALYGLPVTGYSCPTIREIERQADMVMLEMSK